MEGNTVVALTTQRQTRRQIARAMTSAGFTPEFIGEVSALEQMLPAFPADLLIIDCEFAGAPEAIALLSRSAVRPPTVLLSLGANVGPLLDLVHENDIGNLVAKHGAIRAVYPVLDERELLVTCEKVLQRNIFGVEKYLSQWGMVFHRATVRALDDKMKVLGDFENFLSNLDCPPSVVPNIVTVAEELIVNAIVHAPRDDQGVAKYEAAWPAADRVLAEREHVHVTYACDGQRLMLSVVDNFGTLDKQTLHNYLSRSFREEQPEPETKPSGAGLGLSLAFRSIHQLIFNIQESVRTEAIAGWYLRISSASEFRSVGKSLHLFWLPADAEDSARKDERTKSAGDAVSPVSPGVAPPAATV